MTDTFFLPPDDPDLDKGYITGREYMNGVVTGVKTISSKMKTNVIFSGVGADKDGAATHPMTPIWTRVTSLVVST